MNAIKNIYNQIKESAEKEEIKIFEDYTSQTFVYYFLNDKNNNLVSIVKECIEEYVEDTFNYDLNSEGRFSQKQQLEVAELIWENRLSFFNELEDFIYSSFLSVPKDKTSEIHSITIMIGDKKSDGDWDDFHIQWTQEF
jgi:hypothetical protein